MRKYDIHFSDRIPVGEMGSGDTPTINCVGWNPLPSNCRGAGATDMIASVGTNGTFIFKYSDTRSAWLPMKICPRRPSAGSALEWNNNGKSLATSSKPTRKRPGKVFLLDYVVSSTDFHASEIMDCPAGDSVSSLAWSHNDEFLLAVLEPSSQIHFFKKSPDMPFQNLGYSNAYMKYNKVVMQFHPRTDSLFTCGYKSKSIMWKIMQSVTCESGVIQLSFDPQNHLVTVEKNNVCKWWAFIEGNAYHSLTTTFEFEDTSAKNNKRSDVMCIDFSSKETNLMAIGGRLDTIALREYQRIDNGNDGIAMNWTLEGSRPGNVCMGRLNCLKFNPQVSFDFLIF
ncbi:hypothetical protein EJB05_07435, partial [Eragrostis curvula]